MLLTDCVLGRAEELATKPAVIDAVAGTVMTYGELAESVDRTASGFRGHGVGSGAVVGIALSNGPEFCVAFHGALRSGAAVTTTSPLASADELAFQLGHARARHLVTTPAVAEKLRQAGVETATECLFVVGEPSWTALMRGDTPATPVRTTGRTPDELAVLPYSSGTTGLPKGVMLTHANLVANLRQVQPVDGITEDDRAVAVLPFFHIYGMQEVMNLTLMAGATVVTLPRFELGAFLAAVERYRATRASLVPPILSALGSDPAVDGYDLSSLRRVFSGAAPLPVAVADACAGRVGCEVIQGYGLTEASPVTHLMPRFLAEKRGSIGPPLPDTECRVVDLDRGGDVAPGQPGELWVRGPQVMEGYLEDPAATARVLDGDGWLHTGDLVTADADGYYYVLDRVKELIKYKGYAVAPAELEAVLRLHPAVADAAVVRAPDKEAGEVPKAFVVLRAQASAEELMTFVAERVAPFKRVRLIEAVDQIPRSPSGKILRRILVERDKARAVAARVFSDAS